MRRWHKIYSVLFCLDQTKPKSYWDTNFAFRIQHDVWSLVRHVNGIIPAKEKEKKKKKKARKTHSLQKEYTCGPKSFVNSNLHCLFIWKLKLPVGNTVDRFDEASFCVTRSGDSWKGLKILWCKSEQFPSKAIKQQRMFHARIANNVIWISFEWGPSCVRFSPKFNNICVQTIDFGKSDFYFSSSLLAHKTRCWLGLIQFCQRKSPLAIECWCNQACLGRISTNYQENKMTTVIQKWGTRYILRGRTSQRSLG